MAGNEDLVNALSGGGLLNSIAHPTVVNPLAAYGQAAQVAQGIWANRESQAKQLAGQAAQGAIDPATGQYNAEQNRTLLNQAGPGAALAAQQSLLNTQSLSNDQLAQAKAKISWVNAASGAALQSGDYSDSAMLKLFQGGIANGMLTLPEVQRQMALLPPDAAGRQQWLQQHQMTAASTQQQLDQTYGSRQPVNTGPTTEFPVVPPASAGGPGPVVPMGLSPGEGAQRVPTIDNNLYMPDGKTPNPNYGQKVTVPLGTITPSTRGAQPAGGPTAPGAPSPTNQPRLAPPATAGGGGALPSEIPPGADIPIKAANDAWAAANANANTYTQRSFPVTQALALAKSGELTTGQGAQAINDIKSWLQTRASTFGWNVQTIANSKFQELDKYLQQNVNAQPMAAGSDARLASALTGNPSSHLNNLALTDVLKATQALQRMEQMAALDFRARGEPNGQFNRFMSDWQTSHDPRAFVFDQMSDEQRTKMVGGMKDGERAAFGRTLALIKQHPEILNTAEMPH
jgi:hypothetical protein